MLTHFDDCAGIGGFALAARLCGGIVTHWAREIDPYARRVYARHFPSVELFADVRDPLPQRVAGTVGLYTCGFPCQPVSVAGRRLGQADARWLWPYIAAAIRYLRPEWCLLENVPGLRTLGADEVLADLEGAGYASQPLVVGADDVGAPHRRKRVWVVAHTDESGRDGRTGVLRERGWQEPTNGSPWGLEPNVGRVAHGVPARVDRLRCLGNAIVPQVAAWVMRQIVDAHARLALGDVEPR